MENNEENNTVYHNPDGSVFTGTFDEKTMRLVHSYHSDDGTIIDNVVVLLKASPPL